MLCNNSTQNLKPYVSTTYKFFLNFIKKNLSVRLKGYKFVKRNILHVKNQKI